MGQGGVFMDDFNRCYTSPLGAHHPLTLTPSSHHYTRGVTDGPCLQETSDMLPRRCEGHHGLPLPRSARLLRRERGEAPPVIEMEVAVCSGGRHDGYPYHMILGRGIAPYEYPDNQRLHGNTQSHLRDLDLIE